MIGLLIIDGWDRHWCAPAQRRIDAIAPRISRFAEQVRDGGLVIHATADIGLEDFNTHTPHDGPAWPTVRTLPIVCGHGCEPRQAWNGIHSHIETKPEDAYSTDPARIIGTALRFDTLVVAGFHADVCLMVRPYGIPALKHAGVHVVLASDLTDTLVEDFDRMTERVSSICPVMTSEQCA